MQSRPMPIGAILATCALLLGAAAIMALQSLALAADGSFQLVRVLGTGDLFGSYSRILGASVRQGAVVIAARAGVTDTHVLSILLGVGQLVVPAIAWSLAIVLSRRDRLVCAAVMMIAGLSAGAVWLANVCEIVLALPLTTLVAVLLWRPGVWRWRDVAMAAAASSVLVASYETAVVTGAVLAVWAAWRSMSSDVRPERYGCALVAGLSGASVLVAAASVHGGRNPAHVQSFLYFVVSVEPWPLYLALAGIAAVIAAFGSSLDGASQRVALQLGCVALLVAVVSFDPNTVTAFKARGGVAMAGFALELFLWWRWIRIRRGADRVITGHGAGAEPRAQYLLVAVPVIFVAAVIATNVQPVRDWSRSLDDFRVEVRETQGVAKAPDVLPRDTRAVLWGWTSSSLSLIIRNQPNAGILIDPNPSLVPFPVGEARGQLDDAYTWGP
jgi:hypothetical protein